MDEEKFIELTQSSPDFIKKLANCTRPEEISEFLALHNIATTSSESNKIFYAVKYFEVVEDNKDPEKLESASGGVSAPVLNTLVDLVRGIN